VKITLLPGRDDLIAAVASLLSPRGKDYSRQWVVFPERRPGHYLRKALAERQASSFIPPVIDSMEEFVNRLYQERLGLEDRPIEALDATALLFHIHRESPGRLGGDRFLSLDAFFPLGLKMFNDLEEVSQAGLGAERLRRMDGLLGEAIPAESLDRLQSLAHFHERFYEQLAGQGFSTPASRLKAVVDRLKPEHFPDRPDIIFAGVYVLAGLERALLRRLLDWDLGRLIVSRADGWEQLLDALDIPQEARPSAPEGEENGQPVIQFFKSPDTHGQVFAFNKAFETDLRNPERLNEKQAVILCASETLFPLYRQTLAGLPAEAYNISLGYPLARTPLASFFDKLLELVQTQDENGRVYAAHYLRFVLHPYTKNILFPTPEKRADLTRILFHALQEALTRRRMKTFWGLEELEKSEDIRQVLQERLQNLPHVPDPAAFLGHLRSIHDRTVRLFRQIKDVGDFAQKLVRVLETITRHSTAPLHHFFQPYAEAMFREMDGLRNSLFQSMTFEDVASYVQLWRKVIQSGRVPFVGTPLQGLQVLGFWEARGLPLDEVALLDLNEEVIPAFPRTDSLLPLPARRALALPTYEDQERRMSYYFQALLGRAKTVRLFFVENIDKERSRFVEKLLWEKQKNKQERKAETFLQSIQYRVALKTEKPRAVPKAPEMVDKLREFRFSASALDVYLRCPLQFYYRYVLDIKEPEEIAPWMEKKDIGSFVHAVLENFFQPCVGRPVLGRDLDPGRLAEIIRRHFQDFYGGDEVGSAFLLLKQTERHLMDFLKLYQIPVVEDLWARNEQLVILSLEAAWRVEKEFGGRKYLLSARTDRLEQRGDKRYVLDYKTGAQEKYLSIRFAKLDPEKRSTWAEAVGSLQLPVYGLVLSQASGLPPERLNCRLLMLGKNILGRHIECSPYEETDEKKRLDQLRLMESIIGRLLEEIVDPARPFEPEGEGKGFCAECPYFTLCR
jgi:ATP-dependent helicase/nuclease subunit B